MSGPLVSVLMSVYNGDQFLREAVESILCQSLRDLELIVIDDGSTDATAEILDDYKSKDPRVRVFHQENAGLIESLNRGAGFARGKYIARMDADDVSLTDRLMLQVDFLDRNPEVGVVGGAIEVITKTGKSARPDRHPCADHEIKLALLRGDTPLVHPTVLMRKDIFVSVGGYRKVVRDAEDYDLWLRIAECCKLANLDAPVLKYRRHLGQVSVHKFRQEALSNVYARAAALLRRNGKLDPLNSAEEITPKVLTDLGVTGSMQLAAEARSYLICVDSMCDAEEYSFVANLLDEMSHSIDWKHVKKHIIADFHLSRARLYWAQRSFMRSILAAGCAAVTRPIVLGRPFKPLLRCVRRTLMIDTLARNGEPGTMVMEDFHKNQNIRSTQR